MKEISVNSGEIYLTNVRIEKHPFLDKNIRIYIGDELVTLVGFNVSKFRYVRTNDDGIKQYEVVSRFAE